MRKLCAGLLEQNDVKQVGSGPNRLVRLPAQTELLLTVAKYECSGNAFSRRNDAQWDGNF